MWWLYACQGAWWVIDWGSLLSARVWSLVCVVHERDSPRTFARTPSSSLQQKQQPLEAVESRCHSLLLRDLRLLKLLFAKGAETKGCTASIQSRVFASFRTVLATFCWIRSNARPVTCDLKHNGSIKSRPIIDYCVETDCAASCLRPHTSTHAPNRHTHTHRNRSIPSPRIRHKPCRTSSSPFSPWWP